MSVCRNCGSEFSTMSISTMRREFIQHCNTKLQMKFISGLAIQQIKFILEQSRLHRSFRKSCPAKGSKRIIIGERHETIISFYQKTSSF